MPHINVLHCHPDLIKRLSLVAHPIPGAVRVFVAGCPVIHHPSGPPIAAASGTSWLTVREHDSWIRLDPWQTDIALARGIDLLRARIASAYREVEESAWR